ncbi:hypothetical protein CgunFtcFv8_023451 [Champsocephalus gunnari]|uniref:Uncharacterized protein n=2 Tax=Champsocephalus gunnari TaxID=52237 RepID=A0AAN8DKH4_CHAGU|nr:hypothetical protein CgunFtcFv8_023451 [Champsocephalus gunnari]
MSSPARPLLLFQLLSKTASILFLSGAGDSPINTDIPPQRAMHAKRAPYPSGGPAGVYLHLGGYEDRHGEKCHSQRSHLCAVKLRLLEVPEKFSPLLSLPHSPPAKGEDDPWVQEPNQKRLPLSSQGESITQTQELPTQRGRRRGGCISSSQAAPKATYLSRPYSLPH